MLLLSVTLSCLFPSGDTSHHHLKLFICQSPDFPPRMTSWAQGLTVLSTDVRGARRHAYFGDDQGQGPWEAWRTPAWPPRCPSRGVTWRHFESKMGIEPESSCRHRHPCCCHRRGAGRTPGEGQPVPNRSCPSGCGVHAVAPSGVLPLSPSGPGTSPSKQEPRQALGS